MIQGTTGAFANMETKFEKVESRLDQMASSQKMLEVQIGQIANKVGVREQGSLPSQPDLKGNEQCKACLLYTSPSPRDGLLSRMPSSA